jgi:hypothetical protein
VARGQVAQDGVGFPDHRLAIGDHGNAAMRVHGEKLRRVEPAKCAAGVDALMRKTELADQPHHLLDIE